MCKRLVLLLFYIYYPSVPNSFIADGHYYTNLRLGDIIKYDCTPGYSQSGVTVQWRTPDDNLLIMNPLMITVNQSVQEGFYTCIITIGHSDPFKCLQAKNEVFISLKSNVNFIVDLMFTHFKNRYICADNNE